MKYNFYTLIFVVMFFSCKKETESPTTSTDTIEAKHTEIDFFLSTDTAIVGETVYITSPYSYLNPVYQYLDWELKTRDLSPLDILFNNPPQFYKKSYLNITDSSFTCNGAINSEVRVHENTVNDIVSDKIIPIVFKQFVVDEISLNWISVIPDNTPPDIKILDSEIVAYFKTKSADENQYRLAGSKKTISELPNYITGSYNGDFNGLLEQDTKLELAFSYVDYFPFPPFGETEYVKFASSETFNPYEIMDSNTSFRFVSTNFVIECKGHWIYDRY